MDCSFEISASDVFAVLALVISLFSAVFSYFSSKAAKKANEISLLGRKKEIYDAFFELKMHMTQHAEFAQLREVSKFFYHCRNSEFNLPTELASNIKLYFDACFWIAEINQKYGGSSHESSKECEPHIRVEQDLAPKIDRAFKELLKQPQK